MENSSWGVTLGFSSSLHSKYFPPKEEDFKVKESCLQNSCEYLYFVVV